MHVVLMPFAPRFVIYAITIAATLLLLRLAFWRPDLAPFLSVFIVPQQGQLA